MTERAEIEGHRLFRAFSEAHDSEQFVLALQCAFELSQHFPDDPRPLDMIAHVYFAQGKHAAAVEAWLAAARLIEVEVEQLEAEFRKREPTWDHVVRMCGEFEADRLFLLKNLDHLEFRIALAHDNSGHRNRCREHITQAIARRPESVFLRTHLALLDIDEGNSDAAKRQCKTCVALNYFCAFRDEWSTLGELCSQLGLHEEEKRIRAMIEEVESAAERD